MPSVIKKERIKKSKGQAIISTDVNSYSNDPYFENKANNAKQAIEKYGLPQQKQ